MSFRHQLKTRRQFQRFVAMRHPHRKFFGQSLKKKRIGNDIDFSVPVLALVGGTHLASQRVHHELQSIADAKHRQAQFEEARVSRRSVLVIDRPWRSGKNNADGRVAVDLVEFCRAGQHNREDILFADAARNELGILRAKVEDDNALAEGRRVEGRLLLPGFFFHK